MLECDAAVSWAWPHLPAAGLAGGRCERRLHPGLDVNSFFAWLTAFRPTWYAAVPTMHQAILAEARHASRGSGRLSAALRPLRVGSSAAAHLRGAGADFRDLRDRVLRHDGTAAGPSRAIRCRRGQRKVGSVGVPVGLDVAIMDEGGAFAAGGQTGQIVVRGASVMAGYDGDPVANRGRLRGRLVQDRGPGFFRR